jgi:hypothetical protein
MLTFDSAQDLFLQLNSGHELDEWLKANGRECPQPTAPPLPGATEWYVAYFLKLAGEEISHPKFTQISNAIKRRNPWHYMAGVVVHDQESLDFVFRSLREVADAMSRAGVSASIGIERHLYPWKISWCKVSKFLLMPYCNIPIV